VGNDRAQVLTYPLTWRAGRVFDTGQCQPGRMLMPESSNEIVPAGAGPAGIAASSTGTQRLPKRFPS